VRIGPDHRHARYDRSDLGKERVLDADLALSEEARSRVPAGELPQLLHLLRGLDVLVRREVVGHEEDPFGVPHPRRARPFELLEGERCGYVVGQSEVGLDLEELPGLHGRLPGRPGEDLLGERHRHHCAPFIEDCSAFQRFRALT
jgi:hypothetical protein